MARSFGFAFVPSAGARLLAGLESCARLTDLELTTLPFFTSKILAALLPNSPRLARLHLCALEMLDSFAAFSSSSSPSCSSLPELSLVRLPSCPQAELTNLYGLRSLQRLQLSMHEVAYPLMDDLRRSFTPPSPLFPNLSVFLQGSSCN